MRIAALSVAALLLAAPAHAQDIQHGAQVFQTWCAPCHSPGDGNPGTQALEAKYKGAKPAVLQDRTDLSPAVTAFFVRKGVSIMPFFRKTEIGDADLADLGAYLAQKTRPVPTGARQ